jgi:aminoglycoside 6'-N-acetyltransferase I
MQGALERKTSRRSLVFVAEGEAIPCGMVEINLRNVAESCSSSPVPFIEAWYVAPEARRQGIGAALIKAVETWARANGFSELASDARLDDIESHKAHEKVGFEEVERLVAFRKQL